MYFAIFHNFEKYLKYRGGGADLIDILMCVHTRRARARARTQRERERTKIRTNFGGDSKIKHEKKFISTCY